MRCLQCGVTLDRLSRWRGSAEYCSVKCRKAAEDEFNQLVMSRLTIFRPVRSSQSSGDGSMDGANESSVAMRAATADPPEARFLMEGSATLSALHQRDPVPLYPCPLPPLIPAVELPLGNALLALERMIAGFGQHQRSAARAVPGSCRDDLTVPPVPLRAGLPLPGCDPVRPDSRSCKFPVAGKGIWAEPVAAEAVPHRSIPPRRGVRALPPLGAVAPGCVSIVPPPAVSAPSPRIHLPNPELSPFRPRYAFAPPPPAPRAEPPEGPVRVEAQSASFARALSGNRLTVPVFVFVLALGLAGWAYVTGHVPGGTVGEYKSLPGKSDYTVSFTGQIEDQPLVWIFRRQDAGNYYGMKLERTGGAAAGARLVMFAMVNGEAQRERIVPLRDPLPAGRPVQILLDVRGSHFSTHVNGRPADTWVDEQLAGGTFGGPTGRGALAGIRGTKVTY